MPQNHALLILAGIIVATGPIAAQAQKPSPKAIACHAEATDRYIADFRRIGPHEQLSDELTTTTFVNDKLKYDDYYAECLARWNSTKPR